MSDASVLFSAVAAPKSILHPKVELLRLPMCIVLLIAFP